MKISKLDSLRAAAAYADVFDYPLTAQELLMWRVGRAGDTSPVPEALLRHRRSDMLLRKRRARWSQSKWKIARRASSMLHLVPGLLLVGVTGGLAMDNADKDDDIDFFCLTTRDALWTSRLFATLIMDVFGMRRKPQTTDVSDKICLNMFMTEGSYAVGSQDRNLFVAHEILQMVPLWDRGGAYARFLKANEWVKTFLPNAWRERTKNIDIKGSFIVHRSSFVATLIEPLAKSLQLKYMRSRRTTEVITRGVLRFHPQDARPWVEQTFAKKLAKWGMPLDKVFNSP